MNTFRKIFSGFVALSMLAACSNDLPTDKPADEFEENGDGFFMSLDIDMPSGKYSRSETVTGGGSNSGTEVGLDYENTVTSALIVLAAKEEKTDANGNVIFQKYGYIAASEVQSDRIANTSEGTSKSYRAIAKLQKSNLAQLYEVYSNMASSTEGPEVYVFVFGNPTKDLVSICTSGELKLGSANWIDAPCTVIQNNPDKPNENIGIWGANSFLMNNTSLSLRALPASLIAWEPFNSPEKPFHLSDANEGSANNADNGTNNRGAVEIQRSVARFDFKDGSGTGENIYDCLYYTNAEGNIDKENALVAVQLHKMCLVNMSNQFYYLPRVSPNGLLENYTLCGRELPWKRVDGVYQSGNYVVGPWAKEFGSGTIENGFYKYFNYPFFDNDGNFNNADMATNRWDVVKVSDVLKNGSDDKYEGEYKVWRYVTENIIPADETRQKNGITTGIVFKARIRGTEKALTNKWQEEDWCRGSISNIAKCLNGKPFTYEGVAHERLTGTSTKDGDPILYYFNGHLYMGWKHIRQAAIQSAVTVNTAGNLEINRSGSLYKAVFGNGPIPPGNKFVTGVESNGTQIKRDIEDSMWDANTESVAYQNYKASADYAWTEWVKADKPVGATTADNSIETLRNMRSAVTAAGITIFQSSIDDSVPGYYCYYYYWNRHNDNGRDGVMGPMEFDVVRNNVYKISVETISRLGHPRVPANDPDKPTPGTDDESDHIYLDVNVKIADWIVRINNAKF